MSRAPGRAQWSHTPRLTAEQTQHVAAALRRELYNDAGPQTLAQVRTKIAQEWRATRAETPSARANNVRASASTLLAELHAPLPPPPPPPPPPAWRTVSSKRLADARLLLLLAKGKPSAPQPRSRWPRCGKCEPCLRGECGQCVNCLDKRKFGGRGLKKQACNARSCILVNQTSPNGRS